MLSKMVIGVTVIVLTLVHVGDAKMPDAGVQNRKYVVLLGASVGKAWNIESLPSRLTKSGSSPLAPAASRLTMFPYRFEYVGLYQFDKSPALEQLLNRKQNKPHAIIIKECAAYLPGDITFENAKSLMTRWIAQCQEKGIVPIPTTVVPVTRSHDDKFKTHNPLKRAVKWILGISMKTRIEQIIEYNDWIKDYAKQKGLIFLDLEAPLRISTTDRFLRDDLTKGDGLHLNAEAYKLLDCIVIPTLEKIKFPN